jgi:hypothetical protein
MADQNTSVSTVVGSPVHHLVAVVDADQWSYHFTDSPTDPNLVAEEINIELSPIGVKVLPLRPTIEETPGFEPGTPHRYTAHDSGFMAFAIETDINGAVSAVNADGTIIATVPPAAEVVEVDEDFSRNLVHQLVDLVFDIEREQAN